jgi:hypothetical protein
MSGEPDVGGEAELRRLVRSGTGLCVVTGGQTGVDSYAAHAALREQLPVHLVFPRGFRQEDGPLTDSRRARLRGAVLHELTSDSFRYRTWTCVYVADAVLLLDPAGGSGCKETIRAAERIGRPLLTPATGRLAAGEFQSWLRDIAPRVLQIAGCRASVLASHGKGRGLRTQLAELMAVTRRYHQALVHGMPPD